MRSLRFLLIVSAMATCACLARQAPSSTLPAAAPDVCRTIIDLDGHPAATVVEWRKADAAGGVMPSPDWCATVGPIVASSRHALQASAAPSIDTLAIVSWNVHVGGANIASFVQALRDGRLTGGKVVTDFVLLLQEAYRGGEHVPPGVSPGAPVPASIRPTPSWGQRQDIVQIASALDLSLFYVPSMRNGHRPDAGWAAEDRGNAILATRGLDQLTAIELPFTRQRRVAIAATMQVMTPEGVTGTLRIASAHLDVLSGRPGLWLFSSGHRALQARALSQAFSTDTAVVLGADLNTWSEGAIEDAPVVLARAFEDTPPRRRMATFGLLQLDYQFYRLPGRLIGDFVRIDDEFGSDHRPLLGRIVNQRGQAIR